MSRPPPYRLLPEQREFECQGYQYAVTAPHHGSSCPQCGGRIKRPPAEGGERSPAG